MPRVEIIPKDWENSREKAQGDGSPTIDVCQDCHNVYFLGDEGAPLVPERAEDVDDDLKPLARQFPESTIGCTEVEHPDFEGEGYKCEVCGKLLTDEDN